MKRKILIGTLVATAGIASGVAPTFVTSTSVQSSKVDVNPEPVNPEPINPDPINPEPINPDPINPEPVDPTPPQPTLKEAFYPQSLSDFLSYQIDYPGNASKDNVGLNTFLSNLLAQENVGDAKQIKLKDYLVNKNDYQNVDIAYVENSANWENKFFQLAVTPLEGFGWNGKDTDEKIIDVSIQKFNISLISTATAPTKAKLGGSISNLNILSDSDLQNWIVSALDRQGIQILANDGTSTTFSDVQISYLSGSANIANKNFKIQVTPKSGYSWKGNQTAETKTITVDIPQILWAGNSVFLPAGWAVNSFVNSDFRYGLFGYSADKFNVIYQSDFSHIFEYTHPNANILSILRRYWEDLVKLKIYSASIKDLQKNFKVETAINYTDAVWSNAVLRKSAATHFFFKAKVKPQAGYTWYDNHKSDAREIQMNFWVSNMRQTNQPLGKTQDLVNYPSTIDSYYDKNGLPNQYVSLFSTQTNFNGSDGAKKELTQRMLQELSEMYRPWYTFQISNLRSLNGITDIYQPWTFDIKFISVVNPSFTKTIPGYVINDYN
ncbi:MAG: hypothetical protein K2O19_02525 [Malacoplasma sp.]|nr:hypothetical protein [Malacoplasma sp.]